MPHSGETLIHRMLNLPLIQQILGPQWAQMVWTHSWTIVHIAHGQLCWQFWTFIFGCATNGNILWCHDWYRGHNNLGMASTLISGLWLKIWRWCGTMIELLALIKCQFHVPTYRVNVWNKHVFALSTNLVPRFECLFDFRNIGTKLEHFKELPGN
jgi:hypothetical protein